MSALMVVLVVGLLAIAYCVAMLIRNEATSRYLKAVNEKVYEEQIAALHERRSPRLTWSVMHQAIDDYGRIVDRWWRWWHIADYFPPEYRIEEPHAR